MLLIKYINNIKHKPEEKLIKISFYILYFVGQLWKCTQNFQICLCPFSKQYWKRKLKKIFSTQLHHIYIHIYIYKGHSINKGNVAEGVNNKKNLHLFLGNQ